MTGAEHAKDGGHGGHAPGEAGGLERRYRRLLVFYPVAYRRVHDEEMLAVLMTAAPAGKRRPGIAETTDLLAVFAVAARRESRNSSRVTPASR